MMINGAKDEVFSVVESGDVVGMTSQGWSLVAVVHDQDVTPFSETAPNPSYGQPNNHGSNSWDQFLHISKGYVVTRTHYLLKKDPASALADMHTALLSSANKLDAETKLRTDTAKERDELKAELASRGKALLQEVEHAKSLTSRVISFRDSKDKLERDLGKIRTAIGDLRMKEIIG